MLTTLATVKEDLGYTDTAADTRLQRYIAEASSRIEGWCKQPLLEASYSHIERSPGAAILLPPDGKLASTVSITTVTIGSEELDAAFYELDGAILYRLSVSGARVCWGLSPVTVAYQAGYKGAAEAGANVPADLERACIDLVKDLERSRERDSFIRREDYSDGTSLSYGTMGAGQTIFDAKRGPLAPYRKWAPV
ncbi:head-tail connector protein [Nisaea sediminum]|uniref:phage head-tail connector protein n=1 Tax=Nisaea sediminum TaxID=2775867 RepID=UPI00186617CF|nr:phage head-tail connector protein [Nisaea sediminum]